MRTVQIRTAGPRKSDFELSATGAPSDKTRITSKNKCQQTESIY